MSGFCLNPECPVHQAEPILGWVSVKIQGHDEPVHFMNTYAKDGRQLICLSCITRADFAQHRPEGHPAGVTIKGMEVNRNFHGYEPTIKARS